MYRYPVKQPDCTPDYHVFTLTGVFSGPNEPDPFHRCDCGEIMWQDQDMIESVQDDNMYDSRLDTLNHIQDVQKLLAYFVNLLIARGIKHDDSKLHDPERSLFDEYTPKLKDCTYGSDEYKQYLAEMGVALDHHYRNNSHHPEHYENGIADMDLLDIVEMLCDWKAATERHDDGDILKSVEINAKRFDIDDQLKQILLNTVERWMHD